MRLDLHGGSLPFNATRPPVVGDARPAEFRPDALLAAAVRLRIPTKAFDVSLCDLEGFGAALLQLLEVRTGAAAETHTLCGPQLTVVLVELAALVFTRLIASALQQGAAVHCVPHDQIKRIQPEFL